MTTQLSERERYALTYLADHFDPRVWIEAYTLASQEWREILASGDEDLIEALRSKNSATGWGRTLSRLATLHNLVHRKPSHGMWVYQINMHGRLLIEQAGNQQATFRRS